MSSVRPIRRWVARDEISRASVNSSNSAGVEVACGGHALRDGVWCGLGFVVDQDVVHRLGRVLQPGAGVLKSMMDTTPLSIMTVAVRPLVDSASTEVRKEVGVTPIATDGDA